MRPPAVLITLMLLSCAVCQAVDAALPQPVRITSGLLTGVATTDGAVVAFSGIPYAAAPVGALRWREPQPPPAWDGIRHADRAGATCVQAAGAGGNLPYSLIKAKPAADALPAGEDCLCLNVWTPARAVGDRLAVLVNLGGMAGERLARKGIVVVSFTYRVGLIGGFGHAQLSRESPHHVSGNYGFLDQIAALHWVQENIAAFGGDPQRVTIAGYSVGSSFAHHLTVSPLAKGLFRGVIGMSFPYDYLLARNKVGNVHQKEEEGLKFAAVKQLATIADLRAMPAQDLVAPDPGLAPFTRAVLGMLTCIDGWSLPLQYPVAIEQGLIHDVPVLTGFPVDDSGPPAQALKTTVMTFARDLPAVFGQRADAFTQRQSEYLAMCPVVSDEDARAMLKRAQVEYRTATIFQWARLRARHARTPVFNCLITQAPPSADHPRFGAFHTSDLLYEFDNLDTVDLPWSADDRRIADQVSTYWVNFVKTLDPNGTWSDGSALPNWPPVVPEQPLTMALGLTCASVAIAPERLRFYRELLEAP